MSNQSNERFNVVQFFEDGTHEYVRRNVIATEAVEATKHYTNSVAAKHGIVVRVLITDMLDQTVFHWEYKQGIVFPTRDQLEKMGEVK